MAGSKRRSRSSSGCVRKENLNKTLKDLQGMNGKTSKSVTNVPCFAPKTVRFEKVCANQKGFYQARKTSSDHQIFVPCPGTVTLCHGKYCVDSADRMRKSKSESRVNLCCLKRSADLEKNTNNKAKADSSKPFGKLKQFWQGKGAKEHGSKGAQKGAKEPACKRAQRVKAGAKEQCKKPKTNSNRNNSKPKTSLDKYDSKPRTSSCKYDLKPKINFEKYNSHPKTCLDKYDTQPRTSSCKYDLQPKTDLEKHNSEQKTSLDRYDSKPKTSLGTCNLRPKPTLEKHNSEPKTNLDRYDSKPKTSLDKYDLQPKPNLKKYNTKSNTCLDKYNSKSKACFHKYDLKPKTNLDKYDSRHSDRTESGESCCLESSDCYTENSDSGLFDCDAFFKKLEKHRFLKTEPIPCQKQKKPKRELPLDPPASKPRASFVDVKSSEESEPEVTPPDLVEKTPSDHVEATCPYLVKQTLSDRVQSAPPDLEDFVERTSSDLVERTSSDLVEKTPCDIVERTPSDIVEKTPSDFIEITPPDILGDENKDELKTKSQASLRSLGAPLKVTHHMSNTRSNLIKSCWSPRNGLNDIECSNEKLEEEIKNEQYQFENDQYSWRYPKPQCSNEKQGLPYGEDIENEHYRVKNDQYSSQYSCRYPKPQCSNDNRRLQYGEEIKKEHYQVENDQCSSQYSCRYPKPQCSTGTLVAPKDLSNCMLCTPQRSECNGFLNYKTSPICCSLDYSTSSSCRESKNDMKKTIECLKKAMALRKKMQKVELNELKQQMRSLKKRRSREKRCGRSSSSNSSTTTTTLEFGSMSNLMPVSQSSCSNAACSVVSVKSSDECIRTVLDGHPCRSVPDTPWFDCRKDSRKNCARNYGSYDPCTMDSGQPRWQSSKCSQLKQQYSLRDPIWSPPVSRQRLPNIHRDNDFQNSYKMPQPSYFEKQKKYNQTLENRLSDFHLAKSESNKFDNCDYDPTNWLWDQILVNTPCGSGVVHDSLITCYVDMYRVQAEEARKKRQGCLIDPLEFRYGYQNKKHDETRDVVDCDDNGGSANVLWTSNKRCRRKPRRKSHEKPSPWIYPSSSSVRESESGKVLGP